LNKNPLVFTRVLAIGGTVLTGLPVLSPLILTLVLMISEKVFLFDYLMPAEFFPAVFVGAGLLLWAALRAHLFIRPISWTTTTAAALIVLAQGLAIVTGLSSGKVARGGWQEIAATVLIVGYALAVLVLALLGIRLCRALFRKPQA
jgi:hypothetical protein